MCSHERSVTYMPDSLFAFFFLFSVAALDRNHSLLFRRQVVYCTFFTITSPESIIEADTDAKTRASLAMGLVSSHPRWWQVVLNLYICGVRHSEFFLKHLVWRVVGVTKQEEAMKQDNMMFTIQFIAQKLNCFARTKETIRALIQSPWIEN